MIFKYYFSVSGDNLYPERIIERIQGDFVVDSYFSPTDRKPNNKNSEYGYGGVSLWHPYKFSTDDRILEYETAFVEFIEKNYNVFIENGASELQIFIEIYYEGGQCNFEVFNKNLLKKLAEFGVSIPISVYVIKEQELQNWENEIKLNWPSADPHSPSFEY